MIAMTLKENPVFGVSRLQELDNKVELNAATVSDYNEISYFLVTYGAGDYIAITLRENGFVDVAHYLKERREKKEGRTINIATVTGSIRGAIQALTTLANEKGFK